MMVACRTCLVNCEAEASKNLYMKLPENIGPACCVADILTEVAHIQVMECDTFSEMICGQCYDELCNAQSFIRKAQASDRTMRGVSHMLINDDEDAASTKSINTLNPNISDSEGNDNTKIVNETSLDSPKKRCELEMNVNLEISNVTSLNVSHKVCELSQHSHNDSFTMDNDVHVKSEMLEDYEIKQEPNADDTMEAECVDDYYSNVRLPSTNTEYKTRSDSDRLYYLESEVLKSMRLSNAIVKHATIKDDKKKKTTVDNSQHLKVEYSEDHPADIPEAFAKVDEECSTSTIIAEKTRQHNSEISQEKDVPSRNTISNEPVFELDTEKPKRNAEKNKRMLGNAYVGFRRINSKSIVQDSPKEERKMGPACNLAICQRLSTKHCQKFDDGTRRQIFHTFWKKMNWGERKTYIKSMVETKQPKRRRKRNIDASRKRESRVFHLKIGNERIPVCRKMFLNTLGIKEWTIRSWMTKNEHAIGDGETANPGTAV